MMELLSQVKFVISDSGGIQEECAAFGKKVLVCRDTTERPEGIEAGFAKLIDTNIIQNFEWANKNPKWEGKNPYGIGNASKIIIDTKDKNMRSKIEGLDIKVYDTKIGMKNKQSEDALASFILKQVRT